MQAKCAAAEAASRKSEQRAAVREQTAAIAAAAGRVARLQEHADAAQEAAQVAQAEGAHHDTQHIVRMPYRCGADMAYAFRRDACGLKATLDTLRTVCL